MNKMKGRCQMQYEDKDNNVLADLDELCDTEIDSTDYVFIVSGNGALKSVFCPSVDDDDVPMTITDILKVFGIKELNGQPVLH